MNSVEQISISAINAYLYCPVRFYLEYVQGQFLSNEHVAEGRYLGEATKQSSQTKDWKKRPHILVCSDKLGIFGVLDEVIVTQGSVRIVEKKKGNAQAPFKNDVLQLLAYMVCYAESFGVELDRIRGVLVYLESQKNFEVEPSKELVAELEETIKAMNRVFESPPQPIYHDKRCKPCSLLTMCMPVDGVLQRRVMPRSVEAVPLFVSTQGSYVSRFGDSVQVTQSGERQATLHSSTLSSIYLFGSVQVSTQALHLLSQRGIPAVFTDSLGRFKGVFYSGTSKNLVLRLKQYELYRDEERKFALAKRIVYGKLKNQLYVLRRKSLCPRTEAIRLQKLLDSLEDCEGIPELVGLEGLFANEYFTLLGEAFDREWQFDGRNRRPPKDPINAALSFGYTILHNVVLSMVVGVGLDPLLGVLHRERYGRFSLVLDLMEEFRPILVDQLVVSLVNTKQMRKSDFVEAIDGAYVFKDRGKKRFITRFRDRLMTQHYHPLLKSSVEYMRIIEAQVRIFAKCVLRELPVYLPFVQKK